jgi:holo-[acyl-carrier protein] synthase
MAIYGVGIDLVEVDRIKRALEKYGNRLKERIYTKSEQEFCESRNGKFQSYAARFASKEAFSKALGTGLRGVISWRDIVVIDDEKSRPKLEIHGRAYTILNKRKASLSISHTENYAAAVVIIEE